MATKGTPWLLLTFKIALGPHLGSPVDKHWLVFSHRVAVYKEGNTFTVASTVCVQYCFEETSTGWPSKSQAVTEGSIIRRGHMAPTFFPFFCGIGYNYLKPKYSATTHRSPSKFNTDYNVNIYYLVNNKATRLYTYSLPTTLIPIPHPLPPPKMPSEQRRQLAGSVKNKNCVHWCSLKTRFFFSSCKLPMLVRHRSN